MKIELNTSISSSEWGAHGSGCVVDVPDKEATSLIRAGHAKKAKKGALTECQKAKAKEKADAKAKVDAKKLEDARAKAKEKAEEKEKAKPETATRKTGENAMKP